MANNFYGLLRSSECKTQYRIQGGGALLAWRRGESCRLRTFSFLGLNGCNSLSKYVFSFEKRTLETFQMIYNMSEFVVLFIYTKQM